LSTQKLHIGIIGAGHAGIEAALKDILLVLGDRRIAVCRELTKMHEEMLVGEPLDIAKQLEAKGGVR